MLRFFFFKQKTAYEMRISDWSSDVCSSDLAGDDHQTLEKNIGLMIIACILVVSFAGLVQIIPLFFQHSTTQAAPGIEPYSALRLMGRDVYKLGRASCRARVCQYV